MATASQSQVQCLVGAVSKEIAVSLNVRVNVRLVTLPGEALPSRGISRQNTSGIWRDLAVKGRYFA